MYIDIYISISIYIYMYIWVLAGSRPSLRLGLRGGQRTLGPTRACRPQSATEARWGIGARPAKPLPYAGEGCRGCPNVPLVRPRAPARLRCQRGVARWACRPAGCVLMGRGWPGRRSVGCIWAGVPDSDTCTRGSSTERKHVGRLLLVSTRLSVRLFCS